jgi:hypothetical protein
MKKLIMVLFVVAFSGLSFAQTPENEKPTRPLNSINLNFLGDASIISLHYDRLHPINPSMMLSTKIGMGYNEDFLLCIFGPCAPPKSYVTLPHHVTANFGKKKHFLEVGMGGTLIGGDTDRPYMLYPILGYRFLPLNPGNLNFRIFGQYPLQEEGDYLFAGVGISVGYCF